MHHVLMALAGLTRFVRRRSISLLLIVSLLGLNVATVTVSSVFNALSSLVWNALATVPDLANLRPRHPADIEAENARLRADVRTAANQRDAASARLLAAENDTKRLRADLDAKERRLADLGRVEAENTRLRTDVRTAMNDRDAARSRLLAVEDETKRLAELNARSRKQAAEAATSLRNRLAKSLRRSASTEALQAVPLIGTGFVLGAFAYEVKEICEQMQDLEALEAALSDTDAPRVSDRLCLMSFDELVVAFTGRDRGYSRCVQDRINLSQLDPPSCRGYPPAIPEIVDSTPTFSQPVPLPPIIE